MSSYVAFTKKEFLEAYRTWKLLLFCIIYLNPFNFNYYTSIYFSSNKAKSYETSSNNYLNEIDLLTNIFTDIPFKIKVLLLLKDKITSYQDEDILNYLGDICKL